MDLERVIYCAVCRAVAVRLCRPSRDAASGGALSERLVSVTELLGLGRDELHCASDFI